MQREVWACLRTSEVTAVTLVSVNSFHSTFGGLVFPFPHAQLFGITKPNPPLPLAVYKSLRAKPLDASSQKRALEGKTRETNSINMIYLPHRGSALSSKTMHSDNEKQGIPTPHAQSPSYFLRNEEFRQEAFSVASHKSCLWL